MPDQLTYQEFLNQLPEDRRAEIARIWDIVRHNLGSGFVEEIGAKYLTVKAESEWYVALANQKNYISLHLIPIYVFPELREKLYASGKKIKGGKGCINFLRADDLPLDVLGEIVGAHDGPSFVARIREIRKSSRAS